MLNEDVRKNMLYTNGRLVNDIAHTIDEMNIDYPKTYKNLTNDANTNTILTAIQLRSQHMNTNPLGK